jgi:hypothetical protein
MPVQLLFGIFNAQMISIFRLDHFPVICHCFVGDTMFLSCRRACRAHSIQRTMSCAIDLMMTFGVFRCVCFPIFIRMTCLFGLAREDPRDGSKYIEVYAGLLSKLNHVHRMPRTRFKTENLPMQTLWLHTRAPPFYAVIVAADEPIIVVVQDLFSLLGQP